MQKPPSPFSKVVLSPAAFALCLAVGGSLLLPAAAQFPQLPHLPVGGTLGDAYNHAADQVNGATKPVTQAATSVANAAIAPTVQIANVIAGKENLGDAGKNILNAQGEQFVKIGEAVSTANATANNLKVIAAQSIAGDVGKTVMTIETGTDRIQAEFATTTTIAAGKLVQGNLDPAALLTTPFAAALRAAEKQFESDAKPLPPDVRALFAGKYDDDVLNNARWAIGSVSISIPDLVNQFEKMQQIDNAVTVGHVTVFVRDPGQDYHWWAHELQHQQQYKSWGGIDGFALKYVKSCHGVETEAENRAQEVYPVPWKVSLSC